MLVLDVNVVLAAHRAEHAHHALVRPWFDTMLASQERFGVSLSVWASFLRLSSDRRVFLPPTPVEDAFAFITSTRAQPGHRSVEPGPRHLELLAAVCREGGASGNLVPDAVIATTAAEHGATVVTMDRDFARFPSVPHTLLVTA